MSVADQITRIKNAKAAIKQSIENKGVTVSDTAKIDDYAVYIDNITVGSGGESDYENPDFYEKITNGGTNYYYLFYQRTINDTSFIESLDTSKATNMSNMFNYFKSSSDLDLSGWDVPKVKNMSSMFQNCSVPELNVTNWNSNQVTDMSSMFQLFTGNITGLNTLDTSNVTDMDSMFRDCKATTLDLSNWDVNNVTNMNGMFNQAYLEILDISGWDTSNVNDFGSIYWFVAGGSSAQTKKLTSIIGALDLSSCTYGMHYSNTSYYCFKNLSNLETVYLKNIYKNVTTMKNEARWSINLGDTKVKDECLIYIINELPDLINDKGLTATNKIVLTLPTINTLTAEQVQPALDKGWTVANTNY